MNKNTDIKTNLRNLITQMETINNKEPNRHNYATLYYLKKAYNEQQYLDKTYILKEIDGLQ